jgi:hypothetical protein
VSDFLRTDPSPERCVGHPHTRVTLQCLAAICLNESTRTDPDFPMARNLPER